MENINEVYEFYNNGAEIDRLEHGLGIVEFYRSKEIISQYINEKSTIYDIGGGIGKYSEWLTEQGHDVTLIELAPTAVDYAKKNMKTSYVAEIGDAREINKPDDSADVVLLMGPLYHLQDKDAVIRHLAKLTVS
ncbi:MAG: class I SAM-dependent methyltransferase [Ruminococcus sp.]|nr:class I SAM-dependent methyltransferase [Ruminococcus sp.]